MNFTEQLQQIHGTEPCHICGKSRAGAGADICSYPHGMLPVAPADPNHPEGFWTWEKPTQKDK